MASAASLKVCAGATVDWPATLARKGPYPLRVAHLVWRVAPQSACLHTVVLDASGSMLRRGRLALAKAAALTLVQRAARRGQFAALLVVDGRGVHVVQPPAPARRALAVTLRAVAGGGGTPLSTALQQAESLARGWAGCIGGRGQRVLWLLTDGRVRHTPARPAFDLCVLLDFDDDQPPIGQAREWARLWLAHHVMLTDLA